MTIRLPVWGNLITIRLPVQVSPSNLQKTIGPSFSVTYSDSFQISVFALPNLLQVQAPVDKDSFLGFSLVEQRGPLALIVEGTRLRPRSLTRRLRGRHRTRMEKLLFM